MAFDPAVPASDPSRPALEALFERSVAYTAPHTARPIAAGTVVSLAAVVHNPGTQPQDITVALSLPSGVEVASVDDGPTQADVPTWAVTVPGGASRSLRFQVVVPDLVGSYEITSVVKVAGISLADPPRFILEVTRTADQDLGDAIATLEATTVGGQERGHLQSAVSRLRAAQALGTQPADLEAKIQLATQAEEELGRIRSSDLGPVRFAVDLVVAAWERTWFELTATASTRNPETDRSAVDSWRGSRPPFRLAALREGEAVSLR